MKKSEIIEKAGLKIFNGLYEDTDIIYGYASDMLSDVMGRCPEQSSLVTMHTHENVIAVALLREISLVIIVNGREPAENVLKKAEEEEITIVGTSDSAFEICGRLHQLGLSGKYE